jgi:hypothetical protein
MPVRIGSIVVFSGTAKKPNRFVSILPAKTTINPILKGIRF